MYGPIHAAPAEQGGVGRVDDGVHAELGDVGGDGVDGHGFERGRNVCFGRDGGATRFQRIMAKTEDISFGYLLSDVTLLFRKHFDRRAVKFGLTRAQWRATKVLYHRE